ncbi:Uma2 family endonuclease, partial [Aphanizomenon sp. CS-733/32]|nr:Uma2 family endonuclease [Aphanizomenon sp. CS-733/32]
AQEAQNQALAAEQQAQEAQNQALAAEQQAQEAQNQALAAEQQLAGEREKVQILAARLRSLGIDPDTILFG